MDGGQRQGDHAFPVPLLPTGVRVGGVLPLSTHCQVGLERGEEGASKRKELRGAGKCLLSWELESHGHLARNESGVSPERSEQGPRVRAQELEI